MYIVSVPSWGFLLTNMLPRLRIGIVVMRFPSPHGDSFFVLTIDFLNNVCYKFPSPHGDSSSSILSPTPRHPSHLPPATARQTIFSPLSPSPTLKNTPNSLYFQGAPKNTHPATPFPSAIHPSSIKKHPSCHPSCPGPHCQSSSLPSP